MTQGGNSFKAYRKSRRRFVTVLGIFFVLGYSSWQLWLWWLRNEPLDQAASHVSRAFRDRNTSALWYYSFSGDADGHGLTRSDFERLMREYVFPRFQGLVPARVTSLWTQERTAYEHAQIFTLGDREVALDFVMFETPDGPKVYLISPSIVTCLQIDYGGPHQDVAGSKRLWRTLYDGILSERHKLESFGIKGQLDAGPGGQKYSWETMLQVYREYSH